MELFQLVFAILLLGMVTPCLSASSNQSSQSDAVAENVRTETAVLKYLELALHPTHLVGRLDFHGTCDYKSGGYVLFPTINTEPPPNGVSGLAAVREIFRNDPNVVVTESSSQIIRIKIGKISSIILNTKLPKLKLSQIARYNPAWPGAIDMIVESNNVSAAMAKLNVRHVSVLLMGGVQLPLETVPHLPQFLKDTTVNQAFDLIAKTFHGIVLYGECTNPGREGLINTDFYWLPSKR